ncbi:MAG: hypothetical protein IT211_15235 [Armatimonadetes bacterium]|nr:hypothetical protein [Armatimonadota bacterium]
MPAEILDLITMARLGGTAGTFLNSTTYNTPPVAWTANGIAYNSEPITVALATDSGLAMNHAGQFNFSHDLRNQSALLAPPLQKVIFARAGTQWENQIGIAFGGVTYNDLQLYSGALRLRNSIPVGPCRYSASRVAISQTEST